MHYLLSDSDNQLPSLSSVSPDRPSPHSTPPPPSDPDLSLQETNSPAHSTPSTPEGQATSKRVRIDAVRVSIQMRINPPLQMKQHNLHQPQFSRQYCKYSHSIS